MSFPVELNRCEPDLPANPSISVPLTPPPERYNFAAHLLALNSARAGKAAYIDDAGTLSYGALAERVQRFAAGLAGLSLRREERVLLLMHDSSDWPVAFLGCLHAGVVPVCANTLLTAADHASLLAHSRAQAAFVSAALLKTLQAAMEQGPHELRELVVSPAAEPLPPGCRGFETVLADAPAPVAADTAADDIAFWLYSSGSTGRPKGTVHTHANPYWTVET